MLRDDLGTEERSADSIGPTRQRIVNKEVLLYDGQTPHCDSAGMPKILSPASFDSCCLISRIKQNGSAGPLAVTICCDT